MFKIKIADTIFKINNIYPYVERLCKDYIYEGDDFDYEIDSTEELIDEEQKKIPEGESWTRSYMENITVYRAIAMKLLERDAFVMHAAVIAVGDKAYAFTAKSGTGKSTHICLWRKLLGEQVYVVNGDKPALRYIDGKLYAYGTPWCGKDGINVNMKVPLAGICFLKQSDRNEIRRMEGKEALAKVIAQTTYHLRDASKMLLMMTNVERLITEIPIYELCNRPERAAAELSHKIMSENSPEGIV